MSLDLDDFYRPEADLFEREYRQAVEDAATPQAEPGAERTPAFRVDSDAKATWAMRKLRGVKAHIQSNRDIAAAEIERVQQWLDAVNAPLDRDAHFFTGLLEDYGLNQRAEFDRKTIPLPYGTISTREGTPTITFVDEDAFVAWATEHAPDLLKTTVKPVLSEAKRILTITDDLKVISGEGEVVPGASGTEAKTTVTIKTT
jgi:hypothetical protein